MECHVNSGIKLVMMGAAVTECICWVWFPCEEAGEDGPEACEDATCVCEDEPGACEEAAWACGSVVSTGADSLWRMVWWFL